MPNQDESAASPGKSREREVTDPITRRPLLIHDPSSSDLDKISLGQLDPSTAHQSSSNSHDGDRSSMEDLIRRETSQPWWTDPDDSGRRFRTRFALFAGAAAGLGGSASILLSSMLGRLFSGGGGPSGSGGGGRLVWTDLLVGSLGCTVIALATAGFAFYHDILDYVSQKPKDEARERPEIPKEKPSAKPSSQIDPESALWFNSFLSTLWPIVNPILFTSLSDMLEDALQASLPKFIHGVRVADIGQGKEPIRILGIRALDAFEHGVKSMGEESPSENDDKDPEVLDGNYVNLELALAYRARSAVPRDGNNTPSGKSHRDLKTQSLNMHLLIEFYLSGPGMIVFPVFVEVTGFVGTTRTRLQLTPDPPFLSVLTLTFLGQPKVTISVTPLAKNFMNMMDIPFLNSFIQSSIDSVMNSYVAPRSITLDLKSMLTGKEKVDTDTSGVVVVVVKSAEGFKDGDAIKAWKVWKGEDGERERKGDVYVTVGWGKWGKVLWKTRVIQDEGNPVWEETVTLLVGPAETNAKEKIKLQLWDSDRFTAHDNLGSVEVFLEDIMRSKETINTLTTRTDPLYGEDGSKWPGTLTWSCGYFRKTGLDELEKSLENSQRRQQQQHQHQHQKEQSDEQAHVKHDQDDQDEEPPTNPVSELKSSMDQIVSDIHDSPSHSEESKESISKTRKDKEREAIDDLIAGSPPCDEWPSGILSVRVSQISGVEVQKTRGRTANEELKSGETDVGKGEEEGDAPSPYCMIVINHQSVYRTRTKMKERDPYYDAGTERFIPSWLTSMVMIAVRDYRQYESHPLIGVVFLPLRQLFLSRQRSQITDTFPLQGGIGCGRLKFEIVFRSLRIPRDAFTSHGTGGGGALGQAPVPGLFGWDMGTLEVYPETIRFKPDSGQDSAAVGLEGCKIVLRTLYGKGKVIPNPDSSSSQWTTKRAAAAATATAKTRGTNDGKPKPPTPLRLAVLKRFSSCVLVQFKKHHHVLGHKTEAFGTLWLRDVPDDGGNVGSHETDSDDDGEGQGQEVVLEIWEKNEDAMAWARFNYNRHGVAEVRGSVLNEGGQEQHRGDDDDDGKGKRPGGPNPTKLGELRMRVRFWPGLSGYHHHLAKREKSLGEVMEMLDCAENSKDEIRADLGLRFDGGDEDADSSSSSSSSSSSDEEGEDGSGEGEEGEEGSKKGRIGSVGSNVSGLKEAAKDYKARKGELHRKHRGLMQWGFARKLAWVGHEAEDKSNEIKGKIVGRMKHENGNGLAGGIEKEA
ncbi:hypothetical protein K435DRAFT_786410 [Dendrothele bispora CBS 962.96]|uniref:C2 domain-containing protein n=1 Tax=Dendrothele bispora (strain CBS 962.96) TaxID=1314807 RepID=A0A4V4HB53_DENBC|nr:hypothetical protein K435DRAFT_786410 [Dendrothele bispora CBS 962.96]